MVLGCATAVAWWRTQHLRGGTSVLHIYTRTDFRIDGLLVGMALALAWPWIERLPRRVLATVGWLSIAGFTGYVVHEHISIDHLYTVGFTLIAVFAAGIVAAIAASVGPARLFSNRILQHVGRSSYSLYIWHLFVIVTVKRAFPDSSRFALVTSAVLAIALVTVISWNSVEKPAAAFFDRRLRNGRNDDNDDPDQPAP